MGNLDTGELLVIVGVGAGCLLYIGMLILGVWEVIVAHRLKKHARSTTAHVEYVDIRGNRFGVYGKMRFSYTANNKIHSKQQTVSKYVAMGLLSGPKEVSILFLPKKPSVARLAQEPTNYMRMFNMAITLVILVVLVLLALFIILVTINNQPNYY